MTLEAFTVFDEHGARKAQTAGKLEPKMFGRPFQYVPLKDSPASAFEAMMNSTWCSPRFATEECQWYLLKTTLSAEQVLEAIKVGRITYVQPHHTWRWYGELQLGEVSFEWWQFGTAPVGLPTWAEKALTGTYQRGASGACTGCSSSGPTWVSRRTNGSFDDYCASCWHGYFSNTHQGMIAKQGLLESEA